MAPATPTLHGSDPELVSTLKGTGLAQLAILRMILKVSGRNVGRRVLEFPDGTLIECTITYLHENVSITRPKPKPKPIEAEEWEPMFITRPHSGEIVQWTLHDGNFLVDYPLPFVDSTGWEYKEGDYIERVASSTPFMNVDGYRNEQVYYIKKKQWETKPAPGFLYGNIAVNISPNPLKEDYISFKHVAGIAVPCDPSVVIPGYANELIQGGSVTTCMSNTLYRKGKKKQYPYLIAGIGRVDQTIVILGVYDDLRLFAHVAEKMTPVSGLGAMSPIFFFDNAAFDAQGNKATFVIDDESITPTVIPETKGIYHNISVSGAFNYRYDIGNTLAEIAELSSYNKTINMRIKMLAEIDSNGSDHTQKTSDIPVFSEDILTGGTIVGDALSNSNPEWYTASFTSDPPGPDYGYGPTAYLPMGCKPVWTGVDGTSENGFAGYVNNTGCGAVTITATLGSVTISKTVRKPTGLWCLTYTSPSGGSPGGFGSLRCLEQLGAYPNCITCVRSDYDYNNFPGPYAEYVSLGGSYSRDVVVGATMYRINSMGPFFWSSGTSPGGIDIPADVKSALGIGVPAEVAIESYASSGGTCVDTSFTVNCQIRCAQYQIFQWKCSC